MVVTYPVEGHFEHDHADRCGDVTDTLQMALMCADPRLQDIVVVHVDMAASARVIGNIPRRAFGETDLRPQHLTLAGLSKVPAAVEHEGILPTVHTEEYAPNNPKVAPMPRVDGDLGPCIREEVTIRAGLKVYDRKNFLAELHRTGSSRHLGCAHNFTKKSVQHTSREGVDRNLGLIPNFCPCKSGRGKLRPLCQRECARWGYTGDCPEE